jgi:hypothetical protein
MRPHSFTGAFIATTHDFLVRISARANEALLLPLAV